MIEDRDPNAPPDDAGGGDLYPRTLALLRRILVGNGYRIDEVNLALEEHREIVIPGKVELELGVTTQTARMMGQPRGGEQAIFQTREQMNGHLSTLNATLQRDPSWIEDVRSLTGGSPASLWGLKRTTWPMKRLTQRVALVVACDLCHGHKHELCQACAGHREIPCPQCYQQGQVQCPTCFGLGTNPQDRSSYCPQCRGMRVVGCQHCQGRGRIACPTCRATGQTLCRECQGHGFFTEETQVNVVAAGQFVVGSAQEMPPPTVIEIVDGIGIDSIHKGHATVTPDPLMSGTAAPAIFIRAILPYARFRLTLREQIFMLEVVGHKIILHGFPALLDEMLKPVLPHLNLGTLPKYARQFRLVRELTEALAAGEKPRAFFAARYPYGLTSAVAMTLAERLHDLFAGVTTRPRLIAAGSIITFNSAVLYWWLYNPRPEFLPPDVPVFLWDITLILALSALAWLVVEMAGRRALKQVLPTTAKIAATGGRIAQAAGISILLLGLFFLWWPDTRPEWMMALLPKFMK